MEHTDTPGLVDLEGATLKPHSDEDSGSFSDGGYSRKAADFLETQGGKIHPIFEVESINTLKGSTKMAQKAFDKSTELKAKQFLEVMETYQASIKTSTTVALDLRGKHCWEDVLQAAKDAETAYHAAGAKGWRKVGRLVTTNSESVIPYLGLIPNGTYTSILCGGLKLVFQAAAHLGEKRDKVLSTLSRIPDVIAQAGHCVETFPWDQALYDKAAEVYIAALNAIEAITRWLKLNPAWKPVSAFVRGPRYSKAFKSTVLAVDDALGALQERVSMLRDGLIVRTEEVVERVETKVSATQVQIENLQNLQQASLEVQQAREEAKKAMLMVLEEASRTAEWMRQRDRSIKRLRRQVEMLQKSNTSMTPQDLLKILGVSKESSKLDLEKINRAGQEAELSASHMAKGIIEGRVFQNFWSSDTSTALFIEGGCSSDTYGRITPLSLMSSIVIESLYNKEPAFPIYFFCGCHTSSTDRIKGPQGMIRSLICQILQHFTVKLDFIGSRRYSDRLESLNFDSLCDCLGRILRQLPVDTVLFCIIDSICFFEKSSWTQDCGNAIEELQSLIEEDELGPVLKLLITSPIRSRSVGGRFPDHCRLSLLSNDMSNNRTGPTEREISLAARRPLRNMQKHVFKSLKAPGRPDSETDDFSDSLIEFDETSESEGR